MVVRTVRVAQQVNAPQPQELSFGFLRETVAILGKCFGSPQLIAEPHHFVGKASTLTLQPLKLITLCDDFLFVIR